MRNLAGIEAFVAVAEAGSFTKAAERLQTGKSSVSDSVRALEDRLGVRLIERTTRHLRLTEAGTAFVARCRATLDELEAARAEARAHHDAPEGHVRVAVPAGLSERLIVPTLADLLTRYPGLSVELVGSVATGKLIEDGFDLAIRVTDAPANTDVVKRIGVQRMMLVASSTYLDRQGEPVTVDDLARHSLIGTFAPLPWADAWHIDGEDRAIRPRLRVDTVGPLLAAALGGVGIASMPDWLAHEALGQATLRQVLPGHATASSSIYAVYPTHRHLSPAVRLFADSVARQLRSIARDDRA